MSPSHLTELARQLADRLKEDINRCVTREDHVRVTARANEAHHLLTGLVTMFEDQAQTDLSERPFDTSDTNPGLGA